MRNKKTPWLLLSGIWVAPIAIPIAVGYASFFADPNVAWRPRFRFLGYTLHDWLVMICIFALVVLPVFLANLWKYFILKRRDFFPLNLFGEDEDVLEISEEKHKAQQHPVPLAYLSDDPDGLTVGMYRDRLQPRYVRFPFFADPEHQYIHGLPGARKSSLILSALIWNFNYAPRDQRFKSALVVDAKPELALKSVDINRPDIIIINPTVYDSWGFDVWYGLTRGSKDDDVKKRAAMIARALVPDLSGDNEHFSGNAQNILTGFLMYGFYKGKGISETVTEILQTTTTDYIAEILADSEMREKHQKVIAKVKRYEDDDGDGMESIRHTLQKNLDIYDTDTVKYCLDDNPKKASPEDLIKGKSIFLCIPDDDIRDYRTIFGMIMEICCQHLMSRPESNIIGEPPIWVLCDEAGTIYVPSLLETIARGRSRHIQVTVITQDEAMMERTYGSSEARSIRTNCKTKIYLSGGDESTSSDLMKKTGEYRETKVSTHKEGMALLSDGQNVSSEYRPVMNVADIDMLEANNQVLVFAKEGWFLCDKRTYKDIPLIREKSEYLWRKNLGKKPVRESSGISYDKFLRDYDESSALSGNMHSAVRTYPKELEFLDREDMTAEEWELVNDPNAIGV